MFMPRHLWNAGLDAWCIKPSLPRKSLGVILDVVLIALLKFLEELVTASLHEHLGSLLQLKLKFLCLEGATIMVR